MKQILFIVAIVCGIFTQQDVLAQYAKPHPKPSALAEIVPWGDTIIYKGSTIRIGARLRKYFVENIKIEKLGESTKKDLEKGYFIKEVTPQKTTTYYIHYTGGVSKLKQTCIRKIYVVTSEKEKKKIEEIMKAKQDANPIRLLKATH